MTKKQITHLIDCIKWDLFLQKWWIDINWVEKINDSDDELACPAEININFDYQRAIISLYPLFDKLDDVEQRHILIHEMCHILLSDYQRTLSTSCNGLNITDREREKVDESTTQHIASIIWKLNEKKYLKEL